jgi:hypothetical protein
LNLAVWIFVGRQRITATGSSGMATNAYAGAVQTARPLPSIVVRTNAFEWTQLESEDYRTYINRLRSIGCPEETIRDIVIADLEKLMAPEMKELDGPRERPKYWEPKKLTRILDALEKNGKKQEIDFRKREIVRELLGIDLAAERSRVKGESDFYEERLEFLDAEKQTKVRIAMEKANRDEAALRESSWLENDQLTTEEREQLRAIEKRKEEEVAQLLTPEELEQYNLWFSPTAYKVRDAFLTLEPNEEDFLALYRLESEFDAKWDGVEPATLTPEQQREMQEAQKNLEAGIREHLGPERYEKYLLTREPDFHQLQDTVAQFGLKPETVGNVYAVKRVLVDERKRVVDNRVLPAEQRQELLRALSEETERAMVETLGPKPYRYYLRSGAGKWIFE